MIAAWAAVGLVGFFGVVACTLLARAVGDVVWWAFCHVAGAAVALLLWAIPEQHAS